MKLKHLTCAVIVLAVLAGVAFFATRTVPTLSPDARIGQTLVATDVAEKATKLKISDQGKTVMLTRRASGEWTVPDYYDFPADFQKLAGFVGDLTAAKIEQLVTSNPQRLSRLEFKDTQIAFLDAKNGSLTTLIFGKNADAGGRFVRFGDEAKAYRTNLNAWIDADPKSWANPSIVTVKADEVAKVEIAFPNAPSVVATRSKKEAPFTTASAPPNFKLNSDKINSLVSSLVGLRFTDTNAPSDPNALAAKENLRSVIITTFDGQTLSVAMGRKPEQKVMKAPSAKPDGKTGPSALGSVVAASTDHATPQGPAKAAPETETIPAGPVFAFVKSSDDKAPINAMMKTRAFQVYDYGYSTLPQKPEDLFEPAPSVSLKPASDSLPKPVTP